MTARCFYSLLCDELECTSAMFSSNQSTAWETRRDAHEQGWRHIRVRRPRGGPSYSFDFCKDHRHVADDDDRITELVDRRAP